MKRERPYKVLWISDLILTIVSIIGLAFIVSSIGWVVPVFGSILLLVIFLELTSQTMNVLRELEIQEDYIESLKLSNQKLTKELQKLQEENIYGNE